MRKTSETAWAVEDVVDEVVGVAANLLCLGRLWSSDLIRRYGWLQSIRLLDVATIRGEELIPH